MQALKTEGGVIEPEDLEQFGGKYSLWERIKKGGTGSPKTIYKSGIEAFDQLSHNVPGETGFSSFELVKEGLLVRYNINLRWACVGLRLDEIESISIIAHWSKNRPQSWNTEETNQGKLEIIAGSDQLNFEISGSEFSYVLKYFQREELVSKLTYLSA